ncbi:flavodoxin domain-containing protein [Bauldia sp.]|uniref:flavodoxin domain-containing protein n=1 Tax=Bauldia sp. TaxID=2575872 RepID=UPI003BAA5AD7
MRVLICYGTTEGQTRKIAEFVADIVREKGHEAALFDASDVSALEPSRCQAAILAGSVHMGRYQGALVHHIRDWHERLNGMPSAFISVSLAAAGDDPHGRAEIDETAQKMLRDSGWLPKATLHAAGALRFTQYDFFKRWIMRAIARQHQSDVDVHSDTEYTDWDDVRVFVEDFLAKLPTEGDDEKKAG